DWVLAEITQLVEWRPRMRRADAIDALHARDPGVAREVLEDRASYVFWKWVQAGRANAVTPLRKCALPSLLANDAAAAHLTSWRGAVDVAGRRGDRTDAVEGRDSPRPAIRRRFSALDDRARLPGLWGASRRERLHPMRALRRRALGGRPGLGARRRAPPRPGEPLGAGAPVRIQWPGRGRRGPRSRHRGSPGAARPLRAHGAAHGL